MTPIETVLANHEQRKKDQSDAKSEWLTRLAFEDAKILKCLKDFEQHFDITELPENIQHYYFFTYKETDMNKIITMLKERVRDG